MSRTQRLWAVYGTLGVLCAAVALALVLTSDHEPNPLPTILLGEVLGLSFVVAGILGAARRPANGTGRILALVGFTFFAAALGEANAPLPFTIGVALNVLFIGAFVHLLLAYPSGTLATRFERRLVVAAYGLTIAYPVAYLLFAPRVPPSCHDCPRNVFLVEDSHRLATVVEVVASISAAAVMLATIALLVRRWRSASAAYRRSLRLVLLAGGTTIGLFVVQLPLEPLLPHAGDVVLESLAAISFVSVPFAFAAGLLRSRFAGAAVGRFARTTTRVSGWLWWSW